MNDFNIEKLYKLFEKPICNHCLGRQFAQLLSGYNNAQRGNIVRHFFAMMLEQGAKTEGIELSNFKGFSFRHKDLAKLIESVENKPCWLCNDFFDKGIENISKKIIGMLNRYEYKTFVIGTRPSKAMLKNEEKLWESFGIQWCEPIKVEINREIGKIVEKTAGKKADLKNPDITVLVDMEKDEIVVNIRPLYIFGYYQKLVRGIPQCRWGTPGLYKTSVQEEIARPLIKATGGSDHVFHGAGREDISARCLAWRPFVIEITNPIKRSINLKEITKKINKGKKIAVKSLKYCDASVVVKLKSAEPDKKYRALVVLDKPIKRTELSALRRLKGEIKQCTPQRVLHRRADLTRRKFVKSVSYKYKGPKQFELIVHGSAGLYIKELISGDGGRTTPSVAELLNRKAECKELDVIWIGKIKL